MKWRLLYKFTDSFSAAHPDLSGLRSIEAPGGQFYADPISVYQNGVHYIFCELCERQKGRITVFELDDKGTVRGPRPVDLGVSVHLSFSHVFSFTERYYMTPETCALAQINLYECEKFPGKWRLRKTLIDGIHGADPVCVQVGKLWYLFASVRFGQAERLRLYYSDDLFSGWTEHRASYNNLLGFAETKRPAGPIFQCGEGLIRPAQYGERKVYGEAVILYRIDKLTPDEYRETPLSVISHDQLSEQRAIHTLGWNQGLLLLDGRPALPSDPMWKPLPDFSQNAVDARPGAR